MKTPKITQFTLKRIVENIGNIPNKGFSEETPRLSLDEKKRLHEMATMFESFGEVLGKEESIAHSAKTLSEFAKLAESYAINECGDWFQQEIVKKDMKSMKQKVMEYQKTAQECYARMQQLGVLYEDIKHVVDRYYNTKKLQEVGEDSPMPSPVTSPSPLHDPQQNPPMTPPNW